MADAEFTPFETMVRISSRWWITVILAISGGFVGWAFHFFQPSVFEAKAVITITMDFEERDLTQYEQDYVFGAAGALIQSTAVRNQVVAKVQAGGLQINLEQFIWESFLEGKQSVWEMRVRNADPNIATTLVNTWAEIAYQTLAQAQEHAIRAEQLQFQVSAWQACLPTYVTPTPKPNQTSLYSFVWNKECEQYSLEEINNTLAGLSVELATEESQSQGLVSILEFALTETATVPENPVLYNQASLTFAGAMIGFVISLWAAGSRRVPGRG